ncbi:hypothetical protein BGW42_002209 [Actinomortierella wolfii]|nr:hypothetical protein BGW42_002209 [Actinomortierella wolfii]
MPEPLSVLPHDAPLLDAVAPDEIPSQNFRREQRQQQQYSVPTPKAFLPPSQPAKDTKSRRWSLASLFKDRRGSVTGSNNSDSSNAPPLPAPQQSSNRQDRQVVSTHEPSSVSHSTMPSSGNNNLQLLPSIGKRTSRESPPNSQGSSRRSSLVDIPKFFSSLRRGSTSANNDTNSQISQSTSSSYQAPSLIGGFMGRNSVCEETVFGGAGGTLNWSASRESESPSTDEEQDEDGTMYYAVFQGDDDTTLGPNVIAKLATLKPPPPKGVGSQNCPPRSILKKGSITAAGTNASTAAGAGQTSNKAAINNNNPANISSDSLSSASVHPMATDLGPNSWPPAHHRACLVTHSPVPNHQQQQQHHLLFQRAQGLHPTLRLPESLSIAHLHHQTFRALDHKYAPDSPHPLDTHIPPWATSFTDHRAASADDRGGERLPGDVYHDASSSPCPQRRLQAMGDPYVHPMDDSRQMKSGRDETNHGHQGMKVVVVPGSPSPDHSHAFGRPPPFSGGQPDVSNVMTTAAKIQRSNTNNSNTTSTSTSSSTISSQTGNGVKNTTRRIGFLSTVEIIPAHRKSDYNRRSDKNATFRILTPDMKGEIRDELNAYKMREMAVHVQSMGNTAFH